MISLHTIATFLSMTTLHLREKTALDGNLARDHNRARYDNLLVVHTMATLLAMTSFLTRPLDPLGANHSPSLLVPCQSNQRPAPAPVWSRACGVVWSQVGGD